MALFAVEAGSVWRRSDGKARAAAIAAGKTRYSTGLPCKHGHVAEREVTSSNCVECTRIQRHARQSDRARRLREKYGLTIADFYELRSKQEFRCACCNDWLSDELRHIHIDHCHKTGAVRGLLCGDCNIGIGRFRDSTERLEAAIKYLKGR